MGVEPTPSTWKDDVLTVIRPLHIRNPAYKALLHHHWRAGNNSKGDQQTVRNHSMTVVRVEGHDPSRLSARTPKIRVAASYTIPAYKSRMQESNLRSWSQIPLPYPLG